jgi:hypothetical protein
MAQIRAINPATPPHIPLLSTAVHPSRLQIRAKIPATTPYRAAFIRGSANPPVRGMVEKYSFGFCKVSRVSLMIFCMSMLFVLMIIFLR